MGVEEIGPQRPHFFVAEKNSGTGAGNRHVLNISNAEVEVDSLKFILYQYIYRQQL